MPIVSESYHQNKLKKYGINIKTFYIVNYDILERNTDNSKNNDIKNGIRCKKEYYLNNNLVHSETLFDSRIEYTFISQEMENSEYTCPNCGMHSKISNFLDGCPYCKTYYNIEYTEKDLGSKKHYDRCLRSNFYKIITAIIDLILSFFISYIFIKITSRTFNSIDFTKVFIYGFILSLALYYVFYIVDAYIILGPLIKYKDWLNKKQMKFWNRTKMDKVKFFNNLNFELRKKYYSLENIIDFDIIDYDKFNDYKKNKDLFVTVRCEIRLVYYKNNKIKSKYVKKNYTLKKNNNDSIELKGGTNLIKCHNCGASIDILEGKCSYCKTEVKYYQDWILIE